MDKEDLSSNLTWFWTWYLDRHLFLPESCAEASMQTASHWEFGICSVLDHRWLYSFTRWHVKEDWWVPFLENAPEACSEQKNVSWRILIPEVTRTLTAVVRNSLPLKICTLSRLGERPFFLNQKHKKKKIVCFGFLILQHLLQVNLVKMPSH